MIKYIITWCIINTISDPCPNRPTKDEFDRMPRIGSTCAVYHCHHEYECGHRKEFTDKDSAMNFYIRIKKEICVIPQLGTIDSVKFETDKNEIICQK